jgi:hypothetical protein
VQDQLLNSDDPRLCFQTPTPDGSRTIRLIKHEDLIGVPQCEQSRNFLGSNSRTVSDQLNQEVASGVRASREMRDAVRVSGHRPFTVDQHVDGADAPRPNDEDGQSSLGLASQRERYPIGCSSVQVRTGAKHPWLRLPDEPRRAAMTEGQHLAGRDTATGSHATCCVRRPDASPVDCHRHSGNRVTRVGLDEYIERKGSYRRPVTLTAEREKARHHEGNQSLHGELNPSAADRQSNLDSRTRTKSE